jgi:drug/metabolite transporter (DMT)-like permease
MIAPVSGVGLALAAALGWSLFDLSRRFLAGRMTAWALVAWSTLAALPPVLAWGLVAADWRITAAYALPGLGSTAINVAANFAYFRSIQVAPLSVTLPMLSLTPVFSAALGVAALGERLDRAAQLGVVLVVGGAILLSARRDPATGKGWGVERGSVLMGFVALCWSTTLLLDKVAVRHASTPVHMLVLHAGVAAGALLALRATDRLGDLHAVRGNGLLLAATVACGVTALGTQLYAIQRLPIGLVETLKRGVGGFLAVVWGRAFFAEPVTWTKLVAVAILALGVGLVVR